jgi:hypothetical protein
MLISDPLVGNARTLGMQKDLNLTDKQWNLCLTIFFFPYAAFEVPSNMILKILKPNVWLTVLLVAWGTTTTLTALVKDYSGLLAARFCLGLAEVRTTRISAIVYSGSSCLAAVRLLSGGHLSLNLLVLPARDAG